MSSKTRQEDRLAGDVGSGAGGSPADPPKPWCGASRKGRIEAFDVFSTALVGSADISATGTRASKSSVHRAVRVVERSDWRPVITSQRARRRSEAKPRTTCSARFLKLR